jgi:hypothetical protein
VYSRVPSDAKMCTVGYRYYHIYLVDFTEKSPNVYSRVFLDCQFAQVNVIVTVPYCTQK